jgi:hypothetical protein
MPPKPSEILTPEDYKNYREVRAVSVLFGFVASIAVLFSIGLVVATFSIEMNATMRNVCFGMDAIFVLLGIAGVVGSVAAFRGNRKWSKFVWAVAGFYMAFFPVGTLLSFKIIRGLPRYLDSIEQIQAAAANPT